MDAREIKFLHAFNLIPGVGAASLRAIYSNFGSFEDAWKADAASYNNCSLREDILKLILVKKPSINPERELENLLRSQIWITSAGEKQFPQMLAQIPDYPLILYGRGHMPKEDKICLAIVGTRKPTKYGMEAAEELAGALSREGIIIVSGLAFGIDAIAHQAALSARAQTIAVLGSGIDNSSIYPKEHINLAEKIINSGGSIISEYPPGTPAHKSHFPQRNRVISGISRGTLVIEAQEKSGALITARFALEQNREVFAVPGPIYSLYSKGSNNLIKEGAMPVTEAADILKDFGLERQSATNNMLASAYRTSADAAVILRVLEKGSNIDDIKEKTGLDTSRIISELSLLEIRGKIKKIGSDLYQSIK